MQAATPVPHIEQENVWDCGLACVAMVANALGARLSLAEVAMHCSGKLSSSCRFSRLSRCLRLFLCTLPSVHPRPIDSLLPSNKHDLLPTWLTCLARALFHNSRLGLDNRPRLSHTKTLQ